MEPEKEAEETGKVFGADGGDGSVAEVGGADRAALSERERGRPSRRPRFFSNCGSWFAIRPDYFKNKKL